MSLGNDVLSCLRERLTNLGAGGPVFNSAEDHRHWLLGNGNGAPGFIQSPKEALEMTIQNGGAALHAGVVLGESDERDIKSRLADLLFGQVGPANESKLVEGVLLDCPNDPACWYSVMDTPIPGMA